MSSEQPKLEHITLKNLQGMSVALTNFGARITAINFPVQGVCKPMVLGYDSLDGFLDDPFYLGATCGRVCNRVAGGRFQIAGQTYQLPQNDGENCLHGGIENFSFRYWAIDEETLSDTFVRFKLLSQDGDQGFPGELSISVTYQLNDDNALSIQYEANTHKTTAVNMTNHAYFNLGEDNCLDLHLQLFSHEILEIDQQNIPTGNMLSVENTPFDFTKEVLFSSSSPNSSYSPSSSYRTIGQHFNTEDSNGESLSKGFDHCFVLEQKLLESTTSSNDLLSKPSAILTSLKNKIRLSLFTDQNAVQFYTGYYLDKPFSAFKGLCLEAQNHTDAENHAHFPSNILEPNNTYKKHIVYQFDAIT
ncbi:MAG: aldose epimerase family protein [Colwellia sp.]